MAWDALAGQFKKKQRDGEDNALGGEALSQGVQSGGGFSGGTPVADPSGGFGGTGGASGDTGSSRFVNYGTLYGLNEDKAKSMAAGVQHKAEGKAEDAKDSLAAAQNQFNNAAQQGTGKGPGGYRIDSDASRAGTENTFKAGDGWNNYNWDPDTAQRREGSDGQSTRGMGDPTATQTGAANASRYSALLGEPAEYGGTMRGSAQAARDNAHLSASIMDAKSGAGQAYTGPASLKDQMGEEAWAKQQEEFRKAQDSINSTSTAEGIGAALGYTGGIEGSGNAALDTGLTQTAGQANFKKMRERYGGLGKLQNEAQGNSIAAASAGAADSEVAADQWAKMLADYEAEHANDKDPSAPIIIGNASGGQGRVAGTESGISRTEGRSNGDAAGTGADNVKPEYQGTYTGGADGNTTSSGLWPTGVGALKGGGGTDPYGNAAAQKWQAYWANLPQQTKDSVAAMTPEERQAWADAEWAKLNGGK